MVKKPYLAFSDWNHGILLEVYHVSRHNHINWQHLRCAEIVAMDVQFKFLGFLFARMWSAPLKVYIFNVAKLKKEIVKARKAAAQPDTPGGNAKTPKPKPGAKSTAKKEKNMNGTRKRKAKSGAEERDGQDGNEAHPKPNRRSRKAAKQ